MDEGDLTRAVVASYSVLTQDEARDRGQAAAEAVLPARRALWALAERLVPKRLAAALRARLDPEAVDGKPDSAARRANDLRRAIADWLDPPPRCRWCRQPVRPGDDPRVCPAPRSRARGAADREPQPGWLDLPGLAPARIVEAMRDAQSRRRWTPRPRMCRASKLGPPPGATARCGTVALLSAGVASLEVMAAALACPKGAARSYDVAADRDGRALLAATADVPPRDPFDEDVSWSDENLRRVHQAVVLASPSAGSPHYSPFFPIPAPLQAARDAYRAALGETVVANGRAILGLQVRYGVPGGGVCRADLIQGGALGAIRGAADYDPSASRYTTYGAHWIRQGVGEARQDRDLVGTPEWLASLRGQVEDRLPGVSRADVLRAAEALCEALAPDAPASVRARAHTLAADLVRLLLGAEVRENVLGSRPARYTRRPLFADQSEDAVHTMAAQAVRAVLGKAKRGQPAPLTTGEDEDPERARERLATWIGRRIALKKASGSGVLAALRHGAPVFVQIGSGGDDDEDAQGTDGAGGSERAAAVLAAPDDLEREEAEALARERWAAALQALAALRLGEGLSSELRGAEIAEVVRRHHGLDGVAEDRGGATGESFASIAETGLACSGRRLTREALRKMYGRGIEALRVLIAGGRPDLAPEDDDDLQDDPGPVRVPRSPWKSLAAPSSARPTAHATTPPSRPAADDGGAWSAWREAASQVAW